jgi:hypothetical protein
MGLFNIFKKKDEPVDQVTMDELLAFSKQVIAMAIPEIEETKSFLPFGAIVTADGVFELVVYVNPSKEIIDHREHATIVQKLIQQKFKDPKCRLLFMSFDGIAHLPTGDIDSINIRVSSKSKGIHTLLTYPYKIANNKVELIDKDNPIIKSI